MRTQRGLPYGLTLIALLGLAFAGWTHSNPASAQADANNPAPPHGGMMMHGGPASLAATGDFVYVLRGNTLYKMKADDLSLVTQKDLPAPGAEAAAPAAPPAPAGGDNQ
ncbi:MAG TPA: hypothetical protein VFB21_15880 [Chthonomonadaceae bacterium]|nr:hypothetical protein [Chthonomonadaceae bacterium]